MTIFGLKVKEVNNGLRKKLPKNVMLISKSDNTDNHLNRSGLYLNQRGADALAYNIIQLMKSPNF